MGAAPQPPTSLRIVSGGQTGVDRAALDAALALGLPCDGWCPRGRKAEDGPIAARYPLRESPSARYEQRTEWNVRDSDGTLVLTRGAPAGGTKLAIRLADSLGKPCLVVDLEGNPRPSDVANWLQARAIRALNVAGARESESPGIYRRAYAFLGEALRTWEAGEHLPEGRPAGRAPGT